MKISTLFYCLKQGFRNIIKNKWFTLASVATISACLFLFGLFYSILTNFEHMVKTAEEGVSVTALLDGDLSEERTQEIARMIALRDEVRESVYVSADDAGFTTGIEVENRQIPVQIARVFGYGKNMFPAVK